MSRFDFASRHIGVNEEEVAQMLKQIGVGSLDQLIEETVPSSIRLKNKLNIPAGLSEYTFLNELHATAHENKVFKSWIGLGYSNCITPGVIQRNVLENPGWYTAYTPYQAEIAQGRLEALLNFQTMVMDLTGMEIANASLLDEATAAAEAMHVFFASRPRDVQQKNVNKFFVSSECFPQTIDVLTTRSAPLGIELVIGDHTKTVLDETFFGALLQYPSRSGEVHDYKKWVDDAHSKNVQVAVAADLMSLVLLTPPGEWGADVVLGNTQRYGVPLGYGGPHAAYFAAKENYKREMPGRIIGVSIDSHGNRALRMALQTREQHIRRDKATSNICTAQVLLAVMASMYAVYHGPDGIKNIAGSIHHRTRTLDAGLKKLGYSQLNKTYFDTLLVEVGNNLESIRKKLLEAKINVHYIDNTHLSISLDETTDDTDVMNLLSVFAGMKGSSFSSADLKLKTEEIISGDLKRTSEFLTHPVFNTHHSETEMLRYI